MLCSWLENLHFGRKHSKSAGVVALVQCAIRVVRRKSDETLAELSRAEITLADVVGRRKWSKKLTGTKDSLRPGIVPARAFGSRAPGLARSC